MTITTSYFNQKLVLLIGLTVLGLILSWVYFSPHAILPASREEPYQVAEAMPVSAMQKFMVEPMMPAPSTPAPTPTAKPTVTIQPARIDTGQALLAGKAMLKDGNTPKFIGQIDMPFAEYLRTMEGLGCRLAGYDIASQRVAGYFQAGKLVRKPLTGEFFSTQARDITDDMPPMLRDTYLTMLREKTGPGSYRLMLVMPSEVQTRFMGSLSQMLRRAGFDPAQINRVEYKYSKIRQDLVLSLSSITDRNGKTTRAVEATAFASILRVN